MLSFKDIIIGSAMLAVVRGHAAILNAQSDQGGPASIGFKVDPNIARNCTTINPCQQDATLIRDAEINANIVNECGRTEISGNIDIGENTENALAAQQVTQVKAGSTIQVTIHQVNADGAGPFACDLDPTSNALGGSGQIPLEVTNNVPGVNGFSQAKAQQFNITVKLPADLACTGASTGNVCTVRCRNNAVAGPFGGCFPIQQTDVTPTQNTPQNIKTLKDLNTVLAQQQGNAADLPAAIKANQIDGTAEGKKNIETANQLLGVPDVVTKEFPASDTGPSQTGNTGNTGNNNNNTGNNNNNNNANNGNNNNNNANTGNNNNNNGNANAGNGRQRGKANRNGRQGGKRAAKREEGSALRWAKRYIVPGADFQPEVAP
ncbi:gas1-like protein [Colletotrichum truncatum]|uniref:Gas1-like protein n=1 Tax=Colletotrichum truncatum TaxID=5467 RepID=A0ACC3ZC50_COLTU|nr:gas1-like protein [Colletotrichum truncatum]KAF6782244.1 gas1-like protein [Colletotrichum truncatum]